MNLLDRKPTECLGEFLGYCRDVGACIDRFEEIIKETISWLRGKRDQPDATSILQQHWYDSLERELPDFGVYADEMYLCELWACWVVYSRGYLRQLNSMKSLPPRGVIGDLGQVDIVVDVGCGAGYTTAALSEMFSDAEVFGTNLSDSVQTKIANLMAEQYGFKVVSDVKDIVGQADIVFASEYFEHFEMPVEHLRHVVGCIKPKALLIANTFNSDSIGHFNSYNIGGRMVDGREASRRFNQEMRGLGYCEVDTNLWNNRPTYWKRSTKVGGGFNL